jgi:acetylornithine/succinyldiaminopimelate/putrescine aminotransferase
MTLAKALAGGAACGALVARPEFADQLVPGTHAATFGGNPLAARAALATIETIEDDHLLERAGRLGLAFEERFRVLSERCSWIRELRIKGAMIGMELGSDAGPVVGACLERGLLINVTHTSVIRLLPALTLSDAELDQGCSILEEVLLAQNR